MRVFLDANILFSAARSDGAVRRLLELLREAGHTGCVDAFVIEEARRNLAVKEVPRAIADLESLMETLERLPTSSPDAGLLESLPLPEKDRPVLAAAIRGECEALVTGDRTHFGPLIGTTVRGVAVHLPADLAQAILAGQSKR